MEDRKVALVTGAGRGIGKAIALKLAAEGMFVIVNYNGSAQAAADTVKEIEEMGQSAVAMQCDVSDFAACESLFKEVIGTYGRLDVLVNNAGITRENEGGRFRRGNPRKSQRRVQYDQVRCETDG